MTSQGGSPRYETLAEGGDMEDEELRLLGRLHVDQRKWLPEFSSPVPINAGSKMLNDVFWTHKDVVFYARMNFLMAVVSIGLMMCTKELYYKWFNPILSVSGPTQDQYNIYMIVLCANTAATILQIYAIYGYYRSSIRVDQINKRFMSHLRTLWLDQHLYPFLFEVFINIWHEPPFVQHFADISLPINERGLNASPLTPIYCLNPWAVLVFLRVYHLIRFLQAQSYSPGTRIVGNWANFEFTTPFTIRDLLGTYPVASLAFSGIYILFAAGFSAYVMEREISVAHMSMSLGFSWAVTTSFGAPFPVGVVVGTTAGRFVAFVASACGIMWVAAFTATSYANLVLYPYESRMIEFLEYEVCKLNKKQYGAAVIQSAWRWHRTRGQSAWVRWKAKRNMILWMDLFYHNKLKMSMFITSLLESQLFRYQIERLDLKVTNFMREFSKVHHIEQRFEAEDRARAAAQAAKKLAAQLELKRQQAEAEARKTEADFAAEHRAREQKRAQQADREAAAESIAKQIALIDVPKTVIVDPLAIMKVPSDAPIVRWRGDVSQAGKFQGAGIGPFEQSSVSDATSILTLPHRPPSPVKAAKGRPGSAAPVVCKRCLVCYYCRREAESSVVQSVHQCLSCVDPALSPEPLTPREVGTDTVDQGSMVLPGQDEMALSPSSASAGKMFSPSQTVGELELMPMRAPTSHQAAARAPEPSNSVNGLLQPSNFAGNAVQRAPNGGTRPEEDDQDNFLVLPEPGTHARLERLLNTIQTHVVAINRNFASLQQRVEKSESSLAAAEKQLKMKRAVAPK